MEKITRFRGAYAFLSNFYTLECPINYDGILYRSVEHFYQAMKTTDPEMRAEIAAYGEVGLKKFTKGIELREGWDTLKLEVMKYALERKFSWRNPTLAKMLIETGDSELVEENDWGDTFWGICKGKGENHLGKMLMQIREKIK